MELQTDQVDAFRSALEAAISTLQTGEGVRIAHSDTTGGGDAIAALVTSKSAR